MGNSKIELAIYADKGRFFHKRWLIGINLISSRGIVENDNFYDNFVPFLSPHRQKFRHGPKLSFWGLSPISLNRAILCRQEPCSHSDDSSRDELIVRGSYADNAIPAISCEKQFEASPSPRQCRARLWKP